MEELERLFTVQEIAASLRIKEDTLRRWIKNGDVPYTLVGPFRLKRLRPEDIVKRVEKKK